MPANRPAPFLPAHDHLDYLASLLTVLAVLYGAYIVWRHERIVEHAQPSTGPRDWRAG